MNKQYTFECALDCKVGAYILKEGEPLKAVDDKDGLFSLFVEWADGWIARLNAHDVNKLAGCKLIAEENVSAVLELGR